MGKYKLDRNFTDFVHQNLAIPIIYEKLGWTKYNINSDELEKLDIHDGIDYVFLNDKGEKVFIQERFRDSYYQRYSDFTIRYRRDFNKEASKHESEFYKIEANYLVYGITNGKKFMDQRHTLTNFIKYAVIDLSILYNKIESGLIVIPEEINRNSYINEDRIMIAARNKNRDKSSDFVAFDINQLIELFSDDKIIILSYGF